jgi:xyloglucan-specific exo-beta-1,4-glucanase
LIFRSTNGGSSWVNIWHWTRYPSMSHECVYPHDISVSPWLNFTATKQCSGGGRPGPSVPVPLGWMTEALALDPFDPNRFFYGTGATLYGSTDATIWDDNNVNTQFHISVKAKGIEETSIACLVSPPTGPQLVSGIYDIKGFVHTNVDVVPASMHPNIKTPRDMDFAELAPTKFVEVENPDEANCHLGLAVSTDSGKNWTITGAEPSGITGAGTVAYAADGSRAIWAPIGAAAGAYYSKNPGGSNPGWTVCSGFPAGGIVRSDRVNANTFYGFYNGTFYISANGGASFTATGASGLPSSGRFKTMPGVQGDIWLVSGGSSGGVWHSVNGGATFTRLTTVTYAESIGFGKAASGQTYMALYIQGEVNGVRGFFRSTDAGATWLRLNDDQHQWYYSGSTITGDPRIFGRVYIGTNGRGIIYGDP